MSFTEKANIGNNKITFELECSVKNDLFSSFLVALKMYEDSRELSTLNMNLNPPEVYL